MSQMMFTYRNTGVADPDIHLHGNDRSRGIDLYVVKVVIKLMEIELRSAGQVASGEEEVPT
jgi:hypothetical protein